MPPIRKHTSPRLPAFQNKHFGAIYYSSKTENILEHLPLKSGGKLASGSNGLVLLLQSTTTPELLMAAKNFLFNQTCDVRLKNKKRTFMKETAILQECDHENVIKHHYSVLGPRRGMIMMDYCPGGALYVEELTDKQVKKYFMNILSAVRHIHYKWIVHRDIKLDNILVKNDDVFLTDFGLAEKLLDGNRNVSGVVGSDFYMEPEVYRASTSSVYDGFKADSYSMGVYLWCLLKRDEPPEDWNTFSLWTSLQKSSCFDAMDSTLKDCAHQLLAEDPEERVEVTSLHGSLVDGDQSMHHFDDTLEVKQRKLDDAMS